MKRPGVKNVAASVRQRLMDVAKQSGRPFQEVLQYYAMERILYRLAQSPHAERFVLKGALMFQVWRAPTSRPTKDIDLLGRLENSVETLAATFREVCLQGVEPDGLVFDPESLTPSIIKEDAEYSGVRITFRGYLEKARVAMQIDIGFGDVVHPRPSLTEYPTILDDDPPRLRGYPRETAIAEKFDAMVKLGQFNSRLKDFYDIWVLARQFDFDGASLAAAIEKTFAHRGTVVTPRPLAFTGEFLVDGTKQVQWQAFLRKSRLSDAPSELAAVVADIGDFLSPPAAAISEGREFKVTWRAASGWGEPK